MNNQHFPPSFLVFKSPQQALWKRDITFGIDIEVEVEVDWTGLDLLSPGDTISAEVAAHRARPAACLARRVLPGRGGGGAHFEACYRALGEGWGVDR